MRVPESNNEKGKSEKQKACGILPMSGEVRQLAEDNYWGERYSCSYVKLQSYKSIFNFLNPGSDNPTKTTQSFFATPVHP